MEMAPKASTPNAFKKQRSLSETRATPPKAVYNNFSDAHAKITGSHADNWPMLCPGWQKDQPACPSNPKSIPLECVARVVPLSVVTAAEAKGGHIVAAQRPDHVQVISPTIDRPLRHRSVAPNGSPKIPESEVGQPGSMFPGLSRPGSSVNATDVHRWQSLPNPQLDDHPHRRSHSLSRLSGVIGVHNDEGRASLQPGNTVSDILQSYARDHEDDLQNTPFDLHRSAWSRPNSAVTDQPEDSHDVLPDDESEEFPMRIHQPSAIGEVMQRSSPIQASVARARGPELAQNYSYESFQAWMEDSRTASDLFDETDSRVNDHVARVVMLNADGQVRSRPMSQIELDAMEQNVRRQLESPSDIRLVPNDEDAVMDIHRDVIRPYGRLSIQYDHRIGDHGPLRPLSSRSSSSISYGTFHLRQYGYAMGQEPETENQHPQQEGLGTPRNRRGTPPLLYGANRIDRPRGAETVRPMPNGVESEIDWETVDGTSHHNPNSTYMPATVSSHADYSSSSSGIRQRGLPPGVQTIGHPVHPRYAQSWNLLRDERTGRTILLNEEDAQGVQTAGSSIMTPPQARGRLFSDYHHPSPLSQDHTQLFSSSPLSLAPEQGSPGSNSSPLPRPRAAANNIKSFSGNDSLSGGQTSDQMSISEDDSSVLEMVSKSEATRRYNRLSSKKVPSSAWLSTNEGVEANAFVEQSASETDIKHIVKTGANSNVMGTPEGTGAREVGSSLANESSPYEMPGSSPFSQSSSRAMTPNHKTPQRQTVDSSLDTVRTTRLDAYIEGRGERSSSVYSEYFQNQNFTALPTASSHFPLAISDRELQEHRKQLVAHKLLPEEEEPPTPESKHLSLPLNILGPIKSATAATGAALGRQIHYILPHLRQRSPQRSAAVQDETFNMELPTLEETPAKLQKPQRTRDTKKRKVSDSEDSNSSPNHNASSPNVRPLGMAPTNPRASHSTSAQPYELEGVTIHPTTSAHAGDRGFKHATRTRELRNAVSFSSNGRGRPTTPSNRVSAAPAIRPIQGSTQHLVRLQGYVSNEYKGLYLDGAESGQSASEVIRSIIPIQCPIPPPDFTREGLPKARAESPHLLPVPRVRDCAKQRKQKKQISLFFFFLCGLCPPMFVLYGGGYLDGVAAWCSKGNVTAMRSEEKFYGKLMAAFTGVLMLLVVAGVVTWLIAKH